MVAFVEQGGIVAEHQLRNETPDGRPIVDRVEQLTRHQTLRVAGGERQDGQHRHGRDAEGEPTIEPAKDVVVVAHKPEHVEEADHVAANAMRQTTGATR